MSSLSKLDIEGKTGTEVVSILNNARQFDPEEEYCQWSVSWHRRHTIRNQASFQVINSTLPIFVSPQNVVYVTGSGKITLCSKECLTYVYIRLERSIKNMRSGVFGKAGYWISKYSILKKLAEFSFRDLIQMPSETRKFNKTRNCIKQVNFTKSQLVQVLNSTMFATSDSVQESLRNHQKNFLETSRLAFDLSIIVLNYCYDSRITRQVERTVSSIRQSLSEIQQYYYF